MGQVITSREVEEAARSGQDRLDFPADAVITPGALDRARDLQLELYRGGQLYGGRTWRRRGGAAFGAAAGNGYGIEAAFAPRQLLPAPSWSQPFGNGRFRQALAPARLPLEQRQLVDWDRLRSVMRKHQLDGIVAAVPHNVYYLSGLDTEPLWEFPWMSQVVVPLQGEPALILSQLDLIAPVEMDLWIKDVYPYGMGDMVVYDASSLLELEQRLKELADALTPRRSPSNFEAVAKALKERGILGGRLGFDDMRIAGRMPERVNAIDAIEMMREVRMIKTEPEIEKMRDAGATNEAAALAAARFIPRAGSWRDVVNYYRSEMARMNAEGKYLIGGAQHHTGTHQHIHDYQPRRGDFFMVDALGSKSHYYGDFGRTVSWGEPNPVIRKRFNAMRRGFEAGFAMAKPGVKFEDLNSYVREVIRREGNEHHRVTTAHSVGLEHTDMPRRPGHVVEANMTMNIDIAYLEAGFGALHLEDTFVVRPQGAELLTSGKTELIVV